MFAKIIPSLLLPPDVEAEEFTYRVPKKLENDIKVGQIVEIEFTNRKTQGLIIKLEDKSDIDEEKIKDIKRIISKDFLLSDMQIKLIDFFKDTYFINKSLAFNTIIPKIPKK